jgi:hypothetical protein
VNPVLSPGLSRALAAAILVALLGLTFSWIVAPLWDSYAEARWRAPSDPVPASRRSKRNSRA